MATKKKTKDFKAKFDALCKKVEEHETLSNDAMLEQNLKEYGRLVELNEKLWEDVDKNGVSFTDEKSGRLMPNPAISGIQKNEAQLLKISQYLDDKTKAISITDGKKSW